MMMQVAEKFNFRSKYLTHILEGYKVADEMKNTGWRFYICRLVGL
jgi:hypothetical protein